MPRSGPSTLLGVLGMLSARVQSMLPPDSVRRWAEDTEAVRWWMAEGVNGLPPLEPCRRSSGDAPPLLATLPAAPPATGEVPPAAAPTSGRLVARPPGGDAGSATHKPLLAAALPE